MITTVTLGRGRFNISDKGYERLKLLMGNLTGSLPESMLDVVREDAENRLCEYFSAKVAPSNIITHLDIDAAFADLGLGSVSDKKDADQAACNGDSQSSSQNQGTEADGDAEGASSGSPSRSQADDERKPKSRAPWSLNSGDVLIAGVCSGIARQAGCDAVWIRLAFVCATLFLWQLWVPVAYLILWFILPTDNAKDGDPNIRFESRSQGGGCLRIALTIVLCVLALLAVLLGLFLIPFFMLGL